MSFRFAILLLFFIASYNNLQAQKKTNNKAALSHNNKTQIVDPKRAILDSLFKVYYKKYKDEISENYGSKRVVVKSEYGERNIHYVDANNQFIGSETIIPAAKNLIEGDLNNDGSNDLIVSVYYNQGSRPRLNIYCYITQNKKLQFHSQYTANNLGFCSEANDTSGRFFPSKIENGLLVGQTDCLQSGDPGCCPSLEMITYYKFDNGLIFARQYRKKIEK